jgi:hypothetical protein
MLLVLLLEILPVQGMLFRDPRENVRLFDLVG